MGVWKAIVEPVWLLVLGPPTPFSCALGSEERQEPRRGYRIGWRVDSISAMFKWPELTVERPRLSVL